MSRRGFDSRRLVPLAVTALALVLVPLSAAGAPAAQGTLHKLPDFGKVEITLRNTGDAPLTGFRQILPGPFTVTEVETDGATCEIRAQQEQFACTGFSVAPGATWTAVFQTPLVYSDATGTDVTYFPGAGPSTFFVSDSSGAEAGPFEAAWDEEEAETPPLVALGVVSFRTLPTRIVAGKPFSAVLRLSTNDLDALRAAGKVSCSAKVGSRTLRPVLRRLRADARAECRWLVPRGTRGKRVSGRIEVVQSGATALRIFTRRVG